VSDGQGSVRPPDLAPESVRDRDADVLAGWDRGADAEEIASWRRDRRPFPTDTVVVLGAAASGVLLGLLADRGHRTRGALLGGLGGLVGAGVGRRVWRLTA
jgi:hypothetical protein